MSRIRTWETKLPTIEALNSLSAEQRDAVRWLAQEAARDAVGHHGECGDVDALRSLRSTVLRTVAEERARNRWWRRLGRWLAGRYA